MKGNIDDEIAYWRAEKARAEKYHLNDWLPICEAKLADLLEEKWRKEE